MRKLKLLGLLLTIPFLCGCRNSSSGVGIYEDADKYIIGNQTYTGEITKIDIDWTLGKVTLISDENIDGATVVEENNLPDIEKVHSYLKGTELLIKFFASGHYATNLDKKDKELVLTYNPKKITDFDISLTSATLVAPMLVANNKVDISFTSGNASIEGILSPRTDINLTSGTININELNSTKAEVIATSGNVNIKNIKVDDLDVNMTSGNLSLEYVSFKKSSINMTSGIVDVKLPTDGAIANIHKTSGTITINREHTVSGERYVFGTSESTLDIDITSGGVIVS